MRNVPKIEHYNFEEISSLSLEDIINSRILQRDIYRSLVDSYFTNPNPPILVSRIDKGFNQSYIEDIFQLKEDGMHIYFFHSGGLRYLYPKVYKDRLKCLNVDEDIITPGGDYDLDMIGTQKYANNMDLSQEDFFDWLLKDRKTNPSHMNFLKESIGLIPVPFDIPLSRVNKRGGKLQHYSQVENLWLFDDTYIFDDKIQDDAFDIIENGF